ncbi:DUF3180 domain-containing protein [Janibacter sp. GXQ6167]|uniref:DUF3180 domain-containing protein n=1 Tax=Janibacter sp. GXQ6167 TaxID=3240791 RepID=UPI003524C1C1
MLREGLRISTVAIVMLACALVTAFGTAMIAEMPRVPWIAIGLLVLMAVIVLAIGWPVRRHTHGGKRVESLRAARVLGLAQASALTGAGVAGVYLGPLLRLLPDLGWADSSERALRLGLAVLAALAVVVAGLVVQAWCRVNEDDDEDDVPKAPAT